MLTIVYRIYLQLFGAKKVYYSYTLIKNMFRYTNILGTLSVTKGSPFDGKNITNFSYLNSVKNCFITVEFIVIDL